ncbi:hypothetical protein EI94DRAFT_1700544 [Lactarius quietus]|nr:hypothetical protein EI94DRAFT_1700544 [Lactarius quietus]
MLQPTKRPCTSSVARMTTRKPPPRKQANIEWLFHEDNGTIYHDIDDCDICHCWHTHYHDENGKTGTFEQACSDRERWFHHKTDSLRKDLRKAKEKLQTEPGFLCWELSITRSRLVDTKWELEEAWRELENAHRELENSRQELRNTQWAHEYT